MTNISGINALPALSPTPPPAVAPQTVGAGESFKDLLLDSIHQVNGMQQAADQSVESLFTGGDVNPAEVLTAVQKADLAFKMMMQVRNKLVEAYQQVQDVRI